jgi:HSP20 family protein
MTVPERWRERLPSGWDPLREFEDVYERMGRVFRDTFGDLGARWGTWSPLAVGLPLDLEETDDAYIAELDLPGVKKDDLTVEVLGNEIRVHGEAREHERTGVLCRQTRHVGVIDHRFTLPGEVDPARVEAELADGVLTIRAPKTEAAKPQRVEVKVR